MRIAPSTGQSSTQHPQNQHSSGYKHIGGLSFSGLGTSTLERHTSTHALQPRQRLLSKIIDWHGVVGFGTRNAAEY